ncbi:hypothetical protein Tco_0600525 [Tanacetum coccineum]|uniref:Uncharacterized protein n=1 Tax=Tanacetum coccineum TaxID=301880 RepID=A0ABQ4WC27_9ASTR
MFSDEEVLAREGEDEEEERGDVLRDKVRWNKRTKNKQEDEDIGSAEEENYKHLTKKMSMIYTSTPRSLTIINRPWLKTQDDHVKAFKVYMAFSSPFEVHHVDTQYGSCPGAGVATTVVTNNIVTAAGVGVAKAIIVSNIPASQQRDNFLKMKNRKQDVSYLHSTKHLCA